MVNNMAARGRIKLKVYLDENGRVSEVFVSPTTKCKDIVQRLQRKIRQTNCCLVEVWQGCERLVPEDELIQNTLLEWDTDLDDVIFFLRPNEERMSPRLLETDDIQIIEEDLPLPPPPDPGLLVMHNGLDEHNTNSMGLGSSGMSLEELQQLAARQQQEIEVQEQQLANKEQQLRELKQRTRQKIKSSYIDQLEAQIQEQDRKMRHLRQLQDHIEEYRLGNSALDAELQSMEVHFNSKEQELAIAAAKVDGLTEQLNQQREKWSKGNNLNQKSKEEQKLDRLRQELMTRNELNHQQSIQLQAQKQLLAEKHKELFNLDSQIDQLGEELKCKKSQNSVHSNVMHNGSDDYHDNDNGLWESGESFDWSEFANAEDKYDEEVYANYNDSDVNEHHGNPRQGGSRHLETLLEVDETSSVAYSRTSTESSNGSTESPLSPPSGVLSRVSKLASFFETETAEHNASPKDHKPVRSGNERHHFNDVSVERNEPLNQRIQQSSLDSGFYSRTVGSSPLSSPSSLSSLSSFSSSSSASKSLVKHEDFRGIISAETALRDREVKTEGMDTYAVPTYQEKPRTLYEARIYEDSKTNEFNISRKQDLPEKGNNSSSIKMNGNKISQPFNTAGIPLKEQDNNTKPIENTSTGKRFHNVDGPSQSNSGTIKAKPSGTSFTFKHDFPVESSKPSHKKSSVPTVLSFPPVRDILSEASKTQDDLSHKSTSMVENGYNSNNSKNLSSQSDNNSSKHETDKTPGFISKDPGSPGPSKTAISKVKITLVSSGKHPTIVNNDKPHGDSDKGNMTPPRSPQSEKSRFPIKDELLHDQNKVNMTPPRIPHSGISRFPLKEELLGDKNRGNMTPPRSPHSEISRFPKTEESLHDQNRGNMTPPRNPQSDISRFPKKEELLHDLNRGNMTPPRSPQSDISRFPKKEESLHDLNRGNMTPPRSPQSDISRFPKKESLHDQNKGNMTPPRSPHSDISKFPLKEGSLHDQNGRGNMTPPRSPKSDISRFPQKEGSLHDQNRGNMTPPRSPQSDISRFPKKVSLHDQNRGNMTPPRSPHSDIPFFQNQGRSLKDHDKRNMPPPSSPQRNIPTFLNKEELLQDKEKATPPSVDHNRGNATSPRSPNTSKFENWDGIRTQGKRAAKVQPVDSFNAKKVPLSPNAFKNTKTQKDDRMIYKQTNHVNQQGHHGGRSSNRLDSSLLQVDNSNSHKTLPTERKKSRHVSLDPHAVLLDAAVEGELEQVKCVIRDVDDPSVANSDGITALHNAVCGNHEEVVQFLVEYGCDVNLPDSHGWTPLHCAAANNDIIIVQYLVENGACIFATTGLQHKTPALCCEKSIPGYKECVAYLEDIQKNFGVANQGNVYALYAYSATEDDELSFSCGEEIQVLRRGDSTEKEWWWARNSVGQLGYIPRNLFGISPRVAPEV